ncbi:Dabb family protein [Tissierella creatinophila]|uniref:Stress responsive A/B barrel domain protein n=1 Tax=Tissierella creatinophila DSM 6911 TaxID=1123403 RepID=A0A1U7M5L4_TISCR|nr:Dabb family protein [Tissierella creatinophila]OLS02509.1 stress responsive A/B barrel domain protein [Tissierella creatinophila DSM 6911]
MIKHIVMWKIKEDVDGNTKIESSKIVKDMLESLKEDIQEIVELNVGINIVENDSSYDIVLDSKFKSIEDLNTYQKHQDHLKVGKAIAKYIESRAVVDYEF